MIYVTLDIIKNEHSEDSRFLETLEQMHGIHPHIKFNTLGVVRYTKPTDDKLEEIEFTFRLMTRQHNGSFDLDRLSSELEPRMQEQKINQSGWKMHRFIKRTMYIDKCYPAGGCTIKLPCTSRYILNIHNTAKGSPNRVNNYINPDYIIEIKLPKIATPWGYKDLQKIQEINKDKVLFSVFNLNKFKTVYLVLINHNDPKGCNILYWVNH